MVENKTNIEKDNIEEERKVAKISNRAILVLECVICYSSIAIFLTLTIIASYCEMSNALRFVLILVGLVDLLVSCFTAFYLEVKAGCYICAKCGNKHQPSYLKALISPHIGWTRYMKCPKCGKSSWNKKKF